MKAGDKAFLKRAIKSVRQGGRPELQQPHQGRGYIMAADGYRLHALLGASDPEAGQWPDGRAEAALEFISECFTECVAWGELSPFHLHKAARQAAKAFRTSCAVLAFNGSLELMARNADIGAMHFRARNGQAWPHGKRRQNRPVRYRLEMGEAELPIDPGYLAAALTGWKGTARFYVGPFCVLFVGDDRIALIMSLSRMPDWHEKGGGNGKL